MLTDYKFRQIRRDENSTSALVFFFEGEMGEETRLNAKGEKEVFPVYVRTNVVAKKNLVFAGDVETEKMRELLNSELARDKGREPIADQIVTKEPTVEPIHAVDVETDQRVLK